MLRLRPDGVASLANPRVNERPQANAKVAANPPTATGYASPVFNAQGRTTNVLSYRRPNTAMDFGIA